ncbi:Cysteine desulfurase [hydrothermal vent metagenome]|uniref:Cysteine desulfurase n=1 Tax=hydrothermal vent metagenome TaxID=652676 RepID=A0A3B0TVJ8_9ZZZZ
MIPNQREMFDIPEKVAYLNCAYMGPLSRKVAAAGMGGIAGKTRPWTTLGEDFFAPSERARTLFAKVIGATADDIAIVPSVSYGVAVAARNLALDRNQSVICLEDQFPSNVYGWTELAGARGGSVHFVPRAKARLANGQLDWTGAVLDAIGQNTAIVALPHCHWTDGSLLDLAAIGRKARANGAALVLDITQSGGVLPIDIGEVDPDFLVCATYKWLLGPYTMGFLYAAPRHQSGQPIEHGWISRKSSEDFSGLTNYRKDYQPGARRFDMGERSALQLMPMAVAALEQCLTWGVAETAATLAARTGAIAERAGALGFTVAPPEFRAGHFLGLDLGDTDADALVAACTAADVHVSVRGRSMRVTPHLYTTDTDVDRFIDVLAQTARR